MKTISILTSSFGTDAPRALDMLRSAEVEVVINPHKRKVTSEEIVSLASKSIGIIAGVELYDRATLEKLPKLKVISRVGVGMDNVDLKSAKELGIKVFNTPDGPTQAVAELVLGLILGLLRKTSLMDREMRQGSWKKEMGSLLFEKNVGIIGMGRIGKRVATLATAFGAKIAYTDMIDANFPGASRKELNDILKWADVVTLHCSAKEKILGAEQLKLMRRGAWLVNTARGTLVDESALHAALTSGQLSGAALDVFEHEPYAGPLTSLPNVILTPHIGSYARESRSQMEIDAAQNLLKGLPA